MRTRRSDQRGRPRCMEPVLLVLSQISRQTCVDGMDAALGWDRDGQSRSSDAMAISGPDGLGEIAMLGLTLAEAPPVSVGHPNVARRLDWTNCRPSCQH
jgi:hypothetical protein